MKGKNRCRKDKGKVKAIRPVMETERQTGSDWTLYKGEEKILKNEKKIIILEKRSLKEKKV